MTDKRRLKVCYALFYPILLEWANMKYACIALCSELLIAEIKNMVRFRFGHIFMKTYCHRFWLVGTSDQNWVILRITVGSVEKKKVWV